MSLCCCSHNFYDIGNKVISHNLPEALMPDLIKRLCDIYKVDLCWGYFSVSTLV